MVIICFDKAGGIAFVFLGNVIRIFLLAGRVGNYIRGESCCGDAMVRKVQVPSVYFP